MVKENIRKSEMSGFKRVPKKKSTGNAREYDGPPKEFWKGFKEQAADKWYSEIMDDPEDSKTLPAEQVNTLKTEAQKLLENEIESYNRKMSKSSGGSNYNCLRNFMSSGTVSDKIAAYTIAVQDSPVHSLPILRNFVNMVKVGKKKECVQVLDILTELFLSHLLRPDKKLRTFDECPLSVLDQCSSQNKRKSCLILWYFEDQLKELYQTFIKALNTAAHDSVENNKDKAVTSMYKLLSGNPEQESVLLSCLVNKLGDPSQRVASKAVYHLIQLLNVHSNMKFVVMEETEKLLFRPNIGKRAQYYGICFLSQFLLAKEETSLAKYLIRIYLSFFKACVKQGEVDSRLLSALLTGVNRAYPFAKSVMDSMSEHVDTLYKVVHLGNFSVSVHTLSLLFQVADYTNSTSDRFYSALYKKLPDPQLGSSSHQAAFLNLVFKALKKDEDTNRVKVFIKRLLQVCCYLPAHVVCGILLMLSQIKKKNDSVLVCQMVPIKFLDDDDAEEYYEDVKLEEMETGDQKDDLFVESKASTSAATWFHCKNNMNGIDKKPKVKCKTYDAYQRNPTFAGGEYCNHIELVKLAHHYHPSVVHFARKLLQGETFNYSGDALLDFTLPRFLDRFVFKNPKKVSDTEYASSSVFSRKRSYLPSGMKSLRVDTAGYLNEDEENIPVDELFLYRFLQKKRQQKGEDKDDDDDDEDDDESDASSVASEEFLDMLTKSKDTVDFAEELGKAEIEKVKASKKRKTKASSEESESDGDDFESEAEEDEDEVDSEDEEVDGDKAEVEEEEEPSNDEEDASDDKFLEDYLLKDVKQNKHSKVEDVSGDDDDDLDAVDDDDEEAIVFDSDEESEDEDGDDDDSEQEMKKTKTKKGAKLTPEQKFRKKLKGQVAFMPAEKFAELLEERGTIGRKMTGSNALSHKSIAEMKQLKWETDRDFWLNRADKQKRFGTKRKRGGSGKVSGTAKKFRKK